MNGCRVLGRASGPNTCLVVEVLHPSVYLEALHGLGNLAASAGSYNSSYEAIVVVTKLII